MNEDFETEFSPMPEQYEPRMNALCQEITPLVYDLMAICEEIGCPTLSLDMGLYEVIIGRAEDQ